MNDEPSTVAFAGVAMALAIASPAAAQNQPQHPPAVQEQRPMGGMMQQCMQRQEAMMTTMSQMRQMQAQMHGGMQGQMRGMMGQHGGGAGMMGPTAGLQQRLDTACGERVDLATVPRATYMGKTYYFCSNADRRAFERDPERFLRERGMR